MASIIYAGQVTPSGKDVLPTTGPHLDVRVLKDGQYIDPATWRSGLQRLKIGKDRKALYGQKDGQWSTPFEISSGYGPRKSPVAGASTDHKGIDYRIGGGEQLYWEGPGTFKPGKGYGSIMTPEGYEVRLLHTQGGKESQVQGTPVPEQTATLPTQPPVQQQLPQVTVIDLRGKKEAPKTFAERYRDQLLLGYLGLSDSEGRPSFSSLFNPMQMAAQTMQEVSKPINYFA